MEKTDNNLETQSLNQVVELNEISTDPEQEELQRNHFQLTTPRLINDSAPNQFNNDIDSHPLVSESLNEEQGNQDECTRISPPQQIEQFREELGKEGEYSCPPPPPPSIDNTCIEQGSATSSSPVEVITGKQDLNLNTTTTDDCLQELPASLDVSVIHTGGTGDADGEIRNSSLPYETPANEQHIELLARELADNLHKDNLSPSMYSFEEFEREQHEMRAQHYMHQQEAQHRHLAYREGYMHNHDHNHEQEYYQRQHEHAQHTHYEHGHRTDLTIQITDSAFAPYSTLPSPGSQHYPRASQRWYEAEQTPIYENASGTPCSRNDRLYEAMPYRYQANEFTRDKYSPQFPHKPILISKSGVRRVEDNRDEFFQRLYSLHLNNTSMHQSACAQIAYDTDMMANTVHPRVLTEQERQAVTDRLISHQAYKDSKFLAQRKQHASASNQLTNKKHIRVKSERMVTQVHRKALGEIFDVLIVTAQLERDMRQKDAQLQNKAAQVVGLNAGDNIVVENTDASDQSEPESDGDPAAKDHNSMVQEQEREQKQGVRQEKPVPSPSSSSTPSCASHSNEEKNMLDTSLAQAKYLQPKQLADAMTVILTSLAPRIVPREQFIEFTLHCMHKTNDTQQQRLGGQEQQDDQFHTSAAAVAVTPNDAATLRSNTPSEVPLAAAIAAELTPVGCDNATADVNNLQHLSSPSDNHHLLEQQQHYASGHYSRSPKERALSIDPCTPSPSSIPASGVQQHTIIKSSKTSQSSESARTPRSPSTLVIPPIGYLLVAAKTGGSGTASQSERKKGSQAQREYNTHFTGKPKLIAHKTTEKLSKQRYPERSVGKQSVEESLIAYAEVRRNKHLERTIQVEKEQSQHCTFQPYIYPSMARYKLSARPAQPDKNVKEMLRSSSRSRSRTSSEALPSGVTAPERGVGVGDTGELPMEGDNLPGTPDRARVPVSLEQAAQLRMSIESSPGIRATSARRGTPGYISTRPQVLPLQEGDPMYSEFLDQREHLGFGKVRATTPSSSVNMRRTSSNPRQSAPPPRPNQTHIDFSIDRSAEYRKVHLVSPSTTMYVQHNKFSAPSAASLFSTQYAPKPGRFSYDQGALFSKVNKKPSVHALSRSTETTPRAGAGASSPTRYFPPAARSPTTASAMDYKLSHDALHRKMYQELYYNTP